LLERETEEHNASAYINEIAPRYGEPSRNPIELNCNITTLGRESVTKLTLGETLCADVVAVGGGGLGHGGVFLYFQMSLLFLGERGRGGGKK
jgi:hypothetical protein